MDFKDLIVDMKDRVAIITINRPQALNALNAELIRQLALAFNELEKSTDIDVIILTGSGSKAFVAGADIKELSQLDHLTSRTVSQQGQLLMEQIENTKQPVIAAVNGFALGGGCELALACDIRVALETAKLGLPEVTLGLIPGFGGTQRLSRLVGRGKAKQMIFSGEMIGAEEAYRLGLVDELVAAEWKDVPQEDGSTKRKPDGDASKEKLMAFAEKMAGSITKNGQIAVRAAKRAINHGLDMSLHDGNAQESEIFAGLFATEDTAEGLAAFIEKRAANFQKK